MNKLTAYIRYLFAKKYKLGVAKDPRTSDDKAKDYLHEERAIAAFPIYDFEKKITSKYAIENQNQTSSCVLHGTGLSAEIELSKVKGTFITLSKMFGYRQRPNYPGAGTWLQWALDFWTKQGAPLYGTCPTPYSEDEANALLITDLMKNEAKIFENGKYYQYGDPKDIDGIALMNSQGYGVAIVIYATYREWAQMYPQILDNPSFDTAPVRHCIAALPGGSFIENGKRYITIQDSALFGGFFLRYLSEDFIKARCYGAGYLIGEQLSFHEGVKPSATFAYPAKDIKPIQAAMVYEGLLPADCITGFYGPRSIAAVKAFQRLYAADILTPQGITEPTGFVGPATIKKLNALYGA